MNDGLSQRQIRQTAYVSFNLISDCARQFREYGLDSFRARELRSWKPIRLTDKELQQLEQLLLQGATAHGWVNEWWTAKRVAELIRRHFRQRYSPETARRILKRTLGWTPQRPIKQLSDGDTDEIESWLIDDYPHILQRTRRRNAHLVFVDETGFMLTPLLRRTFAPRGQPPITKVVNPHGRISVIGAMAVSPVRRHFRLCFHALPDNENVLGHSVAQFIRDVQTSIGGPITLIWDRYCIHRAEPVMQCLHRRRKLVAEFFPPYASKLNPVDEVWCYVKYSQLANYAPANLNDLRNTVTAELTKLQARPDMLHSLFRRTRLRLDAMSSSDR